MRTEFESDARRLEVHLTLRGLRLERVISENEDVADSSEALNWLVRRINKLTPQCPEGFRSEDNKIQFLRDAVTGKDWASQAISQINTSKYSLNGFVSALREGLQYDEEVKRMKVLDPAEQQTLFTRYGRPPSHVTKFGPKQNSNSSGPRFGGQSRGRGLTHGTTRKNPLDSQGKRIIFKLCGSDSHFARHCPPGAVNRFTRNRIDTGEQPVHVLTDIVKELEHINHAAEDSQGDADTSHDHGANDLTNESINVYDELISSGDNPGQVNGVNDETGIGFNDTVDEQAVTHHITTAMNMTEFSNHMHGMDF